MRAYAPAEDTFNDWFRIGIKIPFTLAAKPPGARTLIPKWKGVGCNFYFLS